MFNYLKITWKSGGTTLFPLAFWTVDEIQRSVSPDNVASSILVAETAPEVAAEA